MTPRERLVPVTAGAGVEAPRRAAAGAAQRLGAYLALTKPRIVELLLVTTLPTMLLAQRGLPPIVVVLATLAGGSLAAGSANTINCYIDRDIDRVMGRTARRPLARDEIEPGRALLFGVALAAGSTLLLGLAVNWLAAILADAAIAFYVFVYTLWLKRRSPSNIVIGGAAGCFPVLVGWAAVTGTVGVPAVLLFAVIFLWTPPHFWSLAMRFSSDYAAAGVPMLPVVASGRAVAGRILAYSYAMVAVTLALTPFVGWPYGAVAFLLGAAFLVEAHRLRARVAAGAAAASMRLFHMSISYLTLLFAAVAVSSFLP